MTRKRTSKSISVQIPVADIHRWYRIQQKLRTVQAQMDNSVTINSIVTNIVLNAFSDDGIDVSGLELPVATQVRNKGRSPMITYWIAGSLEIKHFFLKVARKKSYYAAGTYLLELLEDKCSHLKLPDDYVPYKRAVKRYLRKKYGLTNDQIRNFVSEIKSIADEHVSDTGTNPASNMYKEVESKYGVPRSCTGAVVGYALGAIDVKNRRLAGRSKPRNNLGIDVRDHTEWVTALAKDYPPLNGHRYDLSDLRRAADPLKIVPRELYLSVKMSLYKRNFLQLKKDEPVTPEQIMMSHRKAFLEAKAAAKSQQDEVVDE